MNGRRAATGPRMQVLFDHQIFASQAFGGISRYFCELAARLAGEDGTKASIYAPLHVNHYLRASSVAMRPSLALPRFPLASRVTRAVDVLMSPAFLRNRDVDVFHPTYYYRSAFQPRGSARVITVYDMIHELFPGEFPDSAVLSRRKSVAVRDADHVICISERTRDDAIGILGIAREKTSVVHLGHSLQERHLADVSPDSRQPSILFVGERKGYKNFSLLLEALSAAAPLADLAVRCFGGGAFTSRELAVIDSLSLRRDRITHEGGDDAALARAYADASVFVCPSRYEGFGIPVIEAMSQGCPVACARAGSLPEVAGDAARYFDPGDREDLAQTLLTILFDDTLRSDLAQRGLERARRYSWDRCAAETLAVYRSVLGSDHAEHGT